MGRTGDALRQYESVVPRYPGEEARCRFAVLLKTLGQTERAQALFQEIVKSVRSAPGYYRSRQNEWYRIAREQLADDFLRLSHRLFVFLMRTQPACFGGGELARSVGALLRDGRALFRVVHE